MHEPTAQTSEPSIDIREHGSPKQGAPQTSERRLYVQLQVFTNCKNPSVIIESLRKSGLETVIYADVNDPFGIAVLCLTEDPSVLTGSLRELLSGTPFQSLAHKSDMTMLGRTYSLGREADLEDWLLKKPLRNALNPAHEWAIWYPLRRKAEFELLPKEEQGKILYEHAKIGMAYGQADYAHDIRLVCHGLDKHDNEFVIGLVGKELFPLSRIVQDMRKTQQTAKYIQTLGPFFVGKVLWQSPLR